MVQPQVIVIVIVLPALALFARLTHAGKEVSIEKFAAKRAVKTFCTYVLRQTGNLNPVQINLLALAPGLQHLADKCGAVTHPNPGGHAVAAD